MLRFWNILRTLGDVVPVLNFVILIGFTAVVYTLGQVETASLFPSPLRYLDARESPSGELYYPPDQAAYCWGDTVTWRTNAYADYSAAIQVGYYLTAVQPYQFYGRRAQELESEYPGPKQENVSLYRHTGHPFHSRSGTFIGGQRSFELPLERDLPTNLTLPAGSVLTIYAELDAPFSRSAGYQVDFKLAPGCGVER